MKILLAGGAGQIGTLLIRDFLATGDTCTVLTRNRPTGLKSAAPGVRFIAWDALSLGSWTEEIESSDVVINLAGRSVNCRYTPAHLREMMESRVLSTRLIGQAIAGARRPPALWLQAGTATIYAHRLDAPNDEMTGLIGGNERGVPPLWSRSVAIAQAWEAELNQAQTPVTRKVVLRSAMTMSPDQGGIFDVLATLCGRGLAGTQGNGRQYVSWIHETDFVAAVRWIIANPHLTGAINLSSPHPLPNRKFFAELRRALGARLGLPAPAWLLEIGAWAMRTETELLLKSRRVVPARLISDGFHFRYSDWPAAAAELADRWRSARCPSR